MKNSIIILLGLFILLSACRKEAPIIPPTTPKTDFAENFGDFVARDFLGKIVDENRNPLEDVLITIAGLTVRTDENGFFILKETNVYENFAHIKAEKTGYIAGSRSLVPTTGLNKIKIMLLQENTIATISSGASSEVNLPNGTKVIFDGAFEDENKNAYSGNIAISLHYLDPADPNLLDKMPGMLYAENDNNEENILESYGMINLEMKGDSGQKLQIANGHTAQIQVPITATQQSIAASTIPLWHFDEDKGYWIEEGSASIQGNKYVGTVSHFSWWNCDANFPTTRLCINIFDNASNPLADIKVELWPNASIYPRVGISNTSGQICGLIPTNQSLTLKAYDICGNQVYTSNIGPFTTNTTLPNIILPNSIQTSLVTGNFLACNNTPVTNGYVILKSGTRELVYPVTNGSFSISTIVCNSNTSFTLEAIDYTNLQSSGIIASNFNFPTTNFGTLISCNTVSEIISYQIDNNPPKVFLTTINTNTNGAGFSIYGLDANNAQIYLQANSTTVGTYPFSWNSGMGIEGIDLGQSNTISFNLTNFGAVGQYIDVNFSGTYIDNSSVTHTIVGTFHVIRDN